MIFYVPFRLNNLIKPEYASLTALNSETQRVSEIQMSIRHYYKPKQQENEQ